MASGATPLDKMTHKMGAITISTTETDISGVNEVQSIEQIIYNRIIKTSVAAGGPTRVKQEEDDDYHTVNTSLTTITDDINETIDPDEPINTGYTLVISGLVGIDHKKKIVSPQKFCWTYMKENKEQARLVNRAIEDNMEAWNSIEGCSCVPFSSEIPNWQGPVINVLSGITWGYRGGVTPAPKKNKPIVQE